MALENISYLTVVHWIPSKKKKREGHNVDWVKLLILNVCLRFQWPLLLWLSDSCCSNKENFEMKKNNNNNKKKEFRISVIGTKKQPNTACVKLYNTRPWSWHVLSCGLMERHGWVSGGKKPSLHHVTGRSENAMQSSTAILLCVCAHLFGV